MSPDDPRHGTVRGRSAHRREGTPPCGPCRQAAADYERRRYLDGIMNRPRRIAGYRVERRIRALQALGWSSAHLARELGYSHRDALLSMIRGQWCHRRTALRVFRLYERLCMTPGPSTITKARARKAGWPPPLAWDDIDDPDEQPAGWQYVPGGSRADVLADLDARHADVVEACRVLKMGREALKKWCRRHDHVAVWSRMVAREQAVEEAG